MRSLKLRRSLCLLPLEHRECPALVSGAVDLDFTIDPVTQIPKSGFGAKCASDYDGNYVLSYTFYDPASDENHIYARIYDLEGNLVTNEFQVTTVSSEIAGVDATGQPDYDVAMNQNGHIVFIWSNGESGTWGRAFNFDIVTQKVIPVSDPTQLVYQFDDPNIQEPFYGDVTNIDIDMNELNQVRVTAQGRMIVPDPQPTFSGEDIFTFRVANGNTAVGPPFMINIYTQADEIKPSIGLDYNGDFVITWERNDWITNSTSLWYRKFASGGLPYPSSGISDVPVGVGLTGQQGTETIGNDPEVAVVRSTNQFSDEEMNFVIMWEGTQFRRFNRFGNPMPPADNPLLPPAIYIADIFQGGSNPQLDIGVRGDIYMAWSDNPFDPPPDQDVRGRLYDKDAFAQTPVFEVPAFDGNPSEPPRFQMYPHVAQGGGGNFVTVWHDSSPGGGPRARFSRWLPPRVESVKINDGSNQRSMVKSLEVTFDSYVSVNQPQAVTIRDSANNPMVFSFITANIEHKTHLYITIDSSYVGGSLPDGVYELELNSLDILDYQFWPLDGNNDGIGGDNYTFEFHRLYGDSDGDRFVSAVDFAAFRNALGTSSFTFDYEADGVVASSDFAEFRLRYGTTI